MMCGERVIAVIAGACLLGLKMCVALSKTPNRTKTRYRCTRVSMNRTQTHTVCSNSERIEVIRTLRRVVYDRVKKTEPI